MDNAFDLGSERLIRVIARVEVLTIFFPRLGYSLILDSRHDAATPPAILIERMAGSVEARLRSFAQLRPAFPIPKQLALASWLGSVRAFVETGVHDAIVARWHTLGYPEHDAARALRRLNELERVYLRRVLSGEASRVLWRQ